MSVDIPVFSDDDPVIEPVVDDFGDPVDAPAPDSDGGAHAFVG